MAMQATKITSRHQFHSAFNNWLDVATENDFDKLMAAKQAFAADCVCSMYTLVTDGLCDPTFAAMLPESLSKAMVQFQPIGLQPHVVGVQFAEMQ